MVQRVVRLDPGEEKEWDQCPHDYSLTPNKLTSLRGQLDTVHVYRYNKVIYYT